MTGPDAMPALATIEDALAALRAGRPVLVCDAADRENEGDVVLAAESLTADWLAWTIRHTSGYLCAPLPEPLADTLGLPLMVEDNADSFGTAYTVSVDARAGLSTGISAADRARTIRLLADPAATPGDFRRPGHVLPLRAKGGGVLERPGHTEAAVDLCRMAGLRPVAAIAELVNDDGSMMRLPEVSQLAAEHGLALITIEQLVGWRMRHDRVARVVQTTLATAHGVFGVIGYRDLSAAVEHVALVSPRGLGQGGPGEAPALVRLHSECLTGETFGSQRCDCGPQLDLAMRRVAAEGGVVVYLRGHEGRGVGLLGKLQAYALQDQGLDTVDAQLRLGLPVDARDYTAGAAILYDLGLGVIRLLTNNPAKVAAMARCGLDVVTVEPAVVPAGPASERYLRTKRDRLGHALPPEPRTAAAPDPARRAG